MQTNYFLRAALICLSTLVFAACSPSSTTSSGSLLDTKGGIVKSSDGNASLDITAQTLSAPVSFTLTSSNQSPKPSGAKVLVSGTAYTLSSTPATTLSKPSTLTLKYDPTVVQALSQRLGVKAQAAANTLEIAHLVDNSWQVVTGSIANEADNTVQVSITEMGTYALLAPDGSKAVWQLEVRGGVGAVDSTLAQIGILSQTVNRNFLYIGLTRNGEPPANPVALHVDGPNGYSGDLTFSAGNAWGVYALSTRQAGTFTVHFSGEGQQLDVPVNIDLTPTLALPAITTQITGSAATIGWGAVDGAQSYEVRLYSSGLDLLQVVRTKNLNTSLTIPTGYTASTLAATVLAYSWDSTLERAQKYPSLPATFLVSGGLRVLSTTNPPPSGQPKLSNLSPQVLNIAAATGKTTSASISFYNSGNATLDYTLALTGSAFKLTSGTSGSVYPYSNASPIVIEGTCGATATTLNGSLTITSNDPTAPTTTVPIKLECLPSLTASLKLSRLGHIASLNNLVANATGSQLASRDGNRILLWNTATSRVIRTIETTTSSCCSSDSGAMAYSPDGTKFATVTSSSSLIRVINAATGAELAAISGLSSYNSIAWNPAGTQIAAVGGTNGTQVHIYDASTGAKVTEFSLSAIGTYAYQVLGFNPDSSKLYFLSQAYFSAITVVNSSTGSQTATYEITTGNYYRFPAALMPNNTQVVALAYDTTTNQYRFDLRTAETGTLVRSFGSFTLSSDNYRIAVSPDGANLALYSLSTYNPNSISVWNITAGTLTKTYTPSSASGSFTGGATWIGNSSLALGYSSGLIQTVVASSGANQNLLGYHSWAVNNINFNSANTQVLSGTGNGSSYYSTPGISTLAWANFTTDTNTQRLYDTANSILASRWYSSDSRIEVILRTSSAFLLRSYNAVTGAQLSSISISGVTDSSKFVFSPDGSKLLYTNGSNPTTATIVNAPDGTNPVSLTDLSFGSSTSVGWSFAWSNDNSKIYGAVGDIYTSTVSPTLVNWNTTTGTRTGSIRLISSTNSSSFACYNFSFSNDGSKVMCVTSTYSPTVAYIFETTNGTQVGQLNNLSGSAWYALDTTGNRILTILQNRLEVQTSLGATLLSIPLPAINSGYNQTYTLAWSPNNKYIALGDTSGGLYVWELK